VKDRGEFKFGGTAFLYGHPSERFPDEHFDYLVTARHNVQNAEHFGDLYLRANLKSGGAEIVTLDGQWYYPDNEASDVAVIPVGPGAEFDVTSIGSDLVVTEEVAGRYGLGVGDEVFSVGLFTLHRGKTRNVPLVRSGIVAAMPGEPLEDATSGMEFQAYLVEMRSIGGLSGSPLFAFFSLDRILSGEAAPYQQTAIYLLGLIRGHWQKTGTWLSDSGSSEADTINTGIAIATPIQEVVYLIEGDEDLKRRRSEMDRRGQSSGEC
jgi:hypothetical protein